MTYYLRLCAAAAWTAVLLGGCERSTTELDQGSEDAGPPGLDRAAQAEALALIQDDLNTPVVTAQQALAEAAADGEIHPDELWASLPEGSLQLEWWYAERGYLRLEESEWGPALRLTEAGQAFLGSDADWFTPHASDSPTMSCRAAGTATSALCTAAIRYETRTRDGVELSGPGVAAADALLEASFVPGQGWTVESLEAMDRPPRYASAIAVFGSTQAAQLAQEEYEAAINVRLEQAAQAELDAMEQSGAAHVAERVAGQPVTAVETRAPPARAAVITAPQIRTRPSAAQMSALYPQRALDRGLSGRTDLSCVVDTQGMLQECQVTAETPPAEGFAPAAIRAAPYFRLTPRTVDGRPEASRVSFSISWTPQ